MPSRRRSRPRRRQNSGIQQIDVCFANSVGPGTTTITAAAIGIPTDWPLRPWRASVNALTTNYPAVIQMSVSGLAAGTESNSRPMAVSQNYARRLSVKFPSSGDFQIPVLSEGILTFNVQGTAAGTPTVLITGVLVVQLQRFSVVHSTVKNAQIEFTPPDDDDLEGYVTAVE